MDRGRGGEGERGGDPEQRSKKLGPGNAQVHPAPFTAALGGAEAVHDAVCE